MNNYRIEAGHYLVNGYTILWGGNRCWQIREQDDMHCYEPTLREAIKLAESWREGTDG